MVQEILDDWYDRSIRVGALYSVSCLGARFDAIAWAKKVCEDGPTSPIRSDSHLQCTFFTRGSLTFREAYLRTGRILNISVIPADRHSYVLVIASSGNDN